MGFPQERDTDQDTDIDTDGDTDTDAGRDKKKEQQHFGHKIGHREMRMEQKEGCIFFSFSQPNIHTDINRHKDTHTHIYILTQRDTNAHTWIWKCTRPQWGGGVTGTDR